MLLHESILAKLRHLRLISRRIRPGSLKGDRRSTRRGSSLEFADYRDYTPGDDLRRLDWNAYARSERPYIKLYEEEEDLNVHILLDCSTSMDWGAGDSHKFTVAQKLAAALGTIALAGGDKLSLYRLDDRVPQVIFGPARAPQSILPMLTSLAPLRPNSQTDLNHSLQRHSLQATRPGLLYLISDFLSPNGYAEGMKALAGRGYEVHLLHILHPEELHPPLSGDLRLIDSETSASQELSLDATLLRRYEQTLANWQREIRNHATQLNQPYQFIPSDTSLELLLLHTLRNLHWVG